MEIKNTKKYELKLLTPLHIGNGDKYVKQFDYYIDRTNTNFVDLDQITETIAKTNMNALVELEYINHNNSIADVLRKLKLNQKQFLFHQHLQKIEAQEVNKIIRNGFGEPYIPGSSIKGALRTAIMVSIFNGLSKSRKSIITNAIQDYDGRINKKYAETNFLSKIFGENPFYNLMKALLISDSEPLSQKEISIRKTQVLNLSHNEKFVWKKNYNSDSNMSIFCEAINNRTKTRISLSIDNFLLDNIDAKRIIKFREIFDLSFSNLFKSVNEFSKNSIKDEIDFFTEHRSSLIPDIYLNNLKSINDSIDNISKNNLGCIFRMGWGSGWNFMTGDFLRDYEKLFSEVRKVFRLGKKNFPIFPKTRKVTVQEINKVIQPSLPLGWVYLKELK